MNSSNEISIDRNPLDETTLDKAFFENLLALEKPLDVTELAVFLGKSPKTIGNWVSSGYPEIPSFRLGNKTMFFRSSVVRWLRDLERNGDSACQ